MENDTTNGPAAVEADENYARYAETMGGRMRINLDSRVEMSTNAHHVLFSEFLALSGLFDHLVETAPLVYTSPKSPEKRDVIGTAVLGIVDGARRFRHFDSLRGDGVSAETFGLKKVMHCDSVRRGMLRINSKEGLAWAFMERPSADFTSFRLCRPSASIRVSLRSAVRPLWSRGQKNTKRLKLTDAPAAVGFNCFFRLPTACQRDG